MAGSSTTVERIVLAWWRDRLDYRWLIRTLTARGALRVAKVVLAGGCVVWTAFALANWQSIAGPFDVPRAVATGHVVAAAGLALFWSLAPWPSERGSLLLVAGSDALIAIECLADSGRLFGGLSNMGLVVVGGYVTVFHGPRILAAHVGWSVLLIVMQSWLVFRTHAHTGTAIVSVAAATAGLAMTVLPMLQFFFWVLRMDALSDPLTALVNRRGLDYYVSVGLGPPDHSPICLMTIDLDRFKTVNDTYGHAAGDRVLIRVADCLRAERPPGAVVARSGGEEFVVIARLGPSAAADAGEQLRAAVADAVDPVTASIGVAATESHGPNQRLDRLLHASDSAMYRAKRSGGNTVVTVTGDATA